VHRAAIALFGELERVEGGRHGGAERHIFIEACGEIGGAADGDGADHVIAHVQRAAVLRLHLPVVGDGVAGVDDDLAAVLGEGDALIGERGAVGDSISEPEPVATSLPGISLTVSVAATEVMLLMTVPPSKLIVR
jgi:hypothetical protein